MIIIRFKKINLKFITTILTFLYKERQYPDQSCFPNSDPDMGSELYQKPNPDLGFIKNRIWIWSLSPTGSGYKFYQKPEPDISFTKNQIRIWALSKTGYGSDLYQKPDLDLVFIKNRIWI